VAQADLDKARSTLRAAQNGLADALQAATAAAAALERAKRTSTGVDAAQAAYATAIGTLDGARGGERSARNHLHSEINGRLTSVQGIGNEVGLLSTVHPIVLLPVRIETRFDLPPAPGRPFLRVRVYPDEIFADDFEERLTKSEEVAGLRYWAGLRDGRDRRGAWNDVATRFGGERAAWIVKATRQFADQEPEDEVRDRGPYRPESWTRAVEARLLPDRWIVVAQPISGGAPITVAGGPIREPLALTIDPNPAASEGAVDDEALWTVDYDRARQVGMAIDVPLDEPAGSGRGLSGFSQLLVLGVKSTLTPAQTTDALTRLLAGHRFGRGFDFVRQGTPTNNTAGQPSGYPPPDEDEKLYRVEVAAEWDKPPAVSDGWDFLKLLGLESGREDPYETWRLVHAAGREQQAATNMNAAMWPGTWGYYLQHMMSGPGSTVEGTPRFSPAILEQAKSHFISHVRGRGPLPAFRVGATPYGVLPVSSLDSWVARSGADVPEARLPDKLRRIRDLWRPKLGGLPRINRNPANPDADLVDILALHPSTREVRVRQVIGESAWFNLLWLLRRPLAPWTDEQTRRARELFAQLGESDWLPRVSRSVPWSPARPIKEPILGAEPLSEDDGPASREKAGKGFDYLYFLGNAKPLELLGDEDYFETNHVDAAKRPRHLLYRMLRHAMLTEYVRLAWDWVHAQPGGINIIIFELHNLVAQYQSIWTRMLTHVSDTVTLADWLSQKKSDAPVPGAGGVIPPQAHRDALIALGSLSDGELERLFTETLDLCSHRLDAWISSLFTRRLQDMRVPVVQ
jgi:hypothetical protein